ncbi:MAG: MFS transporter [Chloroflexota bacterium]
MTPTHLDRSYRALLAVPSIGRILMSMSLARIAQAMVGVAIVLFTLDAYGSPAIAGLVTFASAFPGIVVSPIAGALLDRHGRVRLVIVDYLIACASLVLIGVLSLAGLLPAALLVLITAVSSLTSILSNTGLRSLFPLIVPRHLWERVNAVDSNGYVIATIFGPPIAAAAVALIGGAPALILIGCLFALAAIPMSQVREPDVMVSSSGSLMRDAWDGLRYAWGNATIRGLGFSISVLNISGGVVTIVIPLLVLQKLGLGPVAVGVAFAVSGISGMISAFLFGRTDTRGREWLMLVFPTLGFVPSVGLLLPIAASPGAGQPGAIEPAFGFGLLLLSQGLFGALNGPLDIALFTIRQRRTDPAIMGRAFAVSMAFNFLGYPVGAALAGVIAAASLVATVLLGMTACLTSSVLAASLIPRRDPPPAEISVGFSGIPPAP